MYELYLLATLEESDADKNILTGVAGFLNSCRRTCFRNSTVGTNLRQNREPGNDGVWTVEYSAAVTAISLHVLNVNGNQKIKSSMQLTGYKIIVLRNKLTGSVINPWGVKIRFFHQAGENYRNKFFFWRRILPNPPPKKKSNFSGERVIK